MNSNKAFYLTTPLYYVNAKPHLGTAYSTIIADVITRYQKYFGRDVLFLTGTDEHGQKIQQSADKHGQTPIQYCDDVVALFKSVWENLDIKYDIFYRTTSQNHIKTVQSVLQELFDKGEIYHAEYDGWYSVSEEIFLTEKELVNGKSPAGNEVVQISEKNYFFKMSKYQERLIKYIEDNPDFILPNSRKNEVLGFLRKPLGDLCISRPKSRMSWGIEIPFDKDYVTYVWFDALLNYAVAVGLRQESKTADFKKWWQHQNGGANHIIGKDILTTHAVYWSTMLMALEVDLPKTIFAHGWILNRSSEKMSKSKGDTFDPIKLVEEYGNDSLRYFVCRDIHFGNDAPFSSELLIQRINTDLANNIGNLFSRVSQLTEKYFDGKAPGASATDESAAAIAKKTLELGPQIQEKINRWEVSHALEQVMLVLTDYNKYLEEKAPWKLAKENKEAAGQVLQFALEGLRICALHLRPVLPNKMTQLLTQMNCQTQVFSDTLKFDQIKQGTPIAKGSPLFPRLELPKES
jgi:methionyl-tRNA synthetase